MGYHKHKFTALIRVFMGVNAILREENFPEELSRKMNKERKKGKISQFCFKTYTPKILQTQ